MVVIESTWIKYPLSNAKVEKKKRYIQTFFLKNERAFKNIAVPLPPISA